jgi:hypothetical protein
LFDAKKAKEFSVQGAVGSSSMTMVPLLVTMVARFEKGVVFALGNPTNFPFPVFE